MNGGKKRGDYKYKKVTTYIRRKCKGAKELDLETVMNLKSINSLCKLSALFSFPLATITAITPILSSAMYKMARSFKRNQAGGSKKIPLLRKIILLYRDTRLFLDNPAWVTNFSSGDSSC